MAAKRQIPAGSEAVDEQATLGNSGPARGAILGGDTDGASARSGDTDGLATALGAAVNDTETAHSSDSSAIVAGHPGGDRAGLGDGNTEQITRGQKLPNRSASLRGADPLPALMSTTSVVGNSQNAPVGKSKNTPVGKSGFQQQNQQVAKTDWFRYELDFRPLKAGYTVLIRKRLRWSETRYSKMIVKRTCPRLTKKMVNQISVGRFPQTVVAALQDGGIQDGFIKSLQERIGKGNGKRRTDLTDHERSLLARIESGISAGSRSGNA